VSLSRSEAAGRAAAIAMAPPALAFFATLFLEDNRHRTFFDEIQREPGILLVLGPFLGLAAFVAIRPLWSRAPGKIAQRVMTFLAVAALLIASATAFVWSMDRGDRFDHRWSFWAMMPWPAIAGITLGRAGRLEGWASWSHKVAAVGFAMASVACIFISEGTRKSIPDAMLLLVIIIAYLQPVAWFTLWPRRDGPLPAEDAAVPKG
jgi:hypothetical protein